MKIVAFDTETRGLDWHKKDQRAFLATTATQGGAILYDLSDTGQADAFLTELSEADGVVAHNMPFDVNQVWATLGVDLLEMGGKEFHDTDLMARLAIPAGQSRPSYKLKDLAQTYVSDTAKEGEDELKRMAKKAKISLKETGGYYELWRAYPEVVNRYALDDAVMTFALHEFLLSDDPRVIVPLEGNPIWELEQKVQPILIQASRVGVALNQDVVELIQRDYEQQRETHRRRLVTELPEGALGGEGSEDLLIESFLNIGIPLSVKTPTSGKYSTARWALEPFAEEYPIIDAYLGFETANKFLSTFIEPMVGEEVVHTNFGQCEAWTGRMSSWRPNLQNLPTRSESELPIRSMFVPREGHSFVVMDYDSIEIRIYAYYANDQDFRDDITNGRDINAWIASEIADDGRTEDDFHKGTAGESERALAKRTTYGTLYGLGGKGLTGKEPGRFDPGPYFGEDHPEVVKAKARGRGWPQAGYQYKEARDFLARLKRLLPGFHKLNKRIKSTVEQRGYLNTLFGRKQVVSRDKSYVGMNALIQGTAADIMKLGLIKVHEAIQPYGGVILLIVHDEVVVEVPTPEAEACGRAVKEAMEAATDKLDPALVVSGTVVSTNYADAK